MPSGPKQRESANIEAVKEAVEVLRDRVSLSERRIEVVERVEAQYVDHHRQASESDAKIVSDQVAFAQELQRTRRLAQEALDTAKRIEGGQSQLATTALRLVGDTEEQTAMLKKNPRVAKIASVITLAIGVVNVVLELLRQFPFPHH
jgi:hypothetical protein